MDRSSRESAPLMMIPALADVPGFDLGTLNGTQLETADDFPSSAKCVAVRSHSLASRRR